MRCGIPGSICHVINPRNREKSGSTPPTAKTNSAMNCTRDVISDRPLLMLPWLAHGHLSPFLELGKRLSRRGFRVHLCSTPANLSSVKLDNCGGVELVELHLPDLPKLPLHLHTTRNLPPYLMSDLKAAFDLAQSSFCQLLDSLRPSLIVYDFLQPWAATAAASRQIIAVLFLPIGAAAYSFLSHIAVKPTEQFPFPSIRFDDDEEVTRLHRLTAASSDSPSDGARVIQCIELSSRFVLIKTSRGIEEKYLDYASLLRKKELIPTGILVRKPHYHLNDELSEFFMSKQEMAEIARGLELSEVCFMWVVRFPKGEEVPLEDALPKGFLEKTLGRGMVKEEWAPQEGILGHASVGAFVTHCGWGSITEALGSGVPMVAIPQHLDQPLNAKLVTELGVGKEVIRSVDSSLERSYRGEELARVLREVMVGGESEEMRRRSKEMAEVLRGEGEAEEDMVATRLARLLNDGDAVEQRPWSRNWAGDEGRRRRKEEDKVHEKAMNTQLQDHACLGCNNFCMDRHYESGSGS
ncbi:beta-D-glucosyl crocetin beta-1,6-glucosyltransferase-like [Wolffia australiana]